MADYIERETVLNALSVFNDRIHGNEHFLNGIETAKEIVDKTLSADVAPVVHGKWIFHDDKPLGFNTECSVCHAEGMLDGYYCPNCGAKMDLVI